MSLPASLPHVDAGRARSGGPSLRRVVIGFVAALLVGVVVGRFAFLRVDDAGPAGDAAAVAPVAADELATATAAVAASPGDPALLTHLGLAYLHQARRTLDPAFYAKADASIGRALAAQPDDVTTLVAAGVLAGARHDFTGALDLARRARAQEPLAVDPLGVEVDALVELGRYDDAIVTADEMVQRRPDVASLSRASYVAELRGDADGALALMLQAVAASGDRGADAAYVTALLGDLQLTRGNLAAADTAYSRALVLQPTLASASLGAARVLVAKGDLAGAADRLHDLTERLPLPDAVALYGDVLARQGDAAGARAQYDLVRAIEELNRSTGGIAVDLELARFEVARIGRDGAATDAGAALAAASSARAARPTIFADDILAWGLRRAGRPAEALPLAQSAVRYGTADPVLWWHLAAIEADLGHDADARAHLAHARDLRGPLPLLEVDDADALSTRLGLPT